MRKIGLNLLIILINILIILNCNKKNSTDTDEKIFVPETVTDIDGNIYKAVKMGDQIWMAENLKVTHYRNGDPIPNIIDMDTWRYANTGALCAYNFDEDNVDMYGYLYNWFAVNDSRNIAPEGWHVPTDEEWKELEMYHGMNQTDANDTGWRGTDEGKKLKSTSGWLVWHDNDLNGTNEYGFNALPGGYRQGYNIGLAGFYNRTVGAYFWTSTTGTTQSWFRTIGEEGNKDKVNRHTTYKQFGYSIRCVIDN